MSCFAANWNRLRSSFSRRVAAAAVAGFACLVLALVTSGSATATFPGRNGLIAFVSNRHPLLENPQFFAVAVDGGLPRKLTKVAQEAAQGVRSPDGRLVAYTRRAGRELPWEIWLMKADGSARRLLVSGGSPVWSPDGRTIAYNDHDGGWLWTIRVDGSKNRLLADGRNPSWSPSGRRLVFEADVDSDDDAHEVRIANADGTNTRLLAREARLPAWSPNGELIAYASFRGPPHAMRYGIHVVRPDGSGRRRLGPGGAGRYLPIWSSGGARLAYLCDQRPRALCTVDTQGRRRRVIALGVRDDSNEFGGGNSGALLAAWSPRGLRLAYARQDGIFVVSADGRGRRRVMSNSHGALLGRLRWSRDGRRLVLTRMLVSNDFEIYTVRVDGSRMRPLTRNAVSDFSPSWAPDGGRVAFMRQRGRQDTFDIWVMNASGRRQRLVARNGSYLAGLSWTPDGRRIRFTRGRWTYAVSLAGGDERRLMPARYMSSWSPDGTKLAYLRDRPSGGQYIFLARSDGTHARPVAIVDHANRLSWSPDGTTLALGSDSFGEERGIYTIRVDGSGETRVVTTPYAGGSASFSPDGTALAFDAGTGYPTSRIEVIGVAGSSRRVVTAARGGNGNPDWQPLPQ